MNVIDKVGYHIKLPASRTILEGGYVLVDLYKNEILWQHSRMLNSSSFVCWSELFPIPSNHHITISILIYNICISKNSTAKFYIYENEYNIIITIYSFIHLIIYYLNIVFLPASENTHVIPVAGIKKFFFFFIRLSNNKLTNNTFFLPYWTAKDRIEKTPQYTTKQAIQVEEKKVYYFNIKA